MSPEQYDIKTFAQETLSFSLIFYSDNEGTTPVDLTGFSAALRIMDKPNGTVIDTLTESDGISLGGVDGSIVIERSSDDVQAWKIDTGAYDLVINSGSQKLLLLHGTVEVVKT